jgi:hypothetical protein
MSFLTSALKLTQPRYPGKKQHQYHCLRCSHWTPHNSPKRQLSNVHKGFQSHLGSILPQLFQSHNGGIAAEEYRRLIYLITGESDVGEIIWGKQLAERAQQDLLGQG